MESQQSGRKRSRLDDAPQQIGNQPKKPNVVTPEENEVDDASPLSDLSRTILDLWRAGLITTATFPFSSLKQRVLTIHLDGTDESFACAIQHLQILHWVDWNGEVNGNINFAGPQRIVWSRLVKDFLKYGALISFEHFMNDARLERPDLLETDIVSSLQQLARDNFIQLTKTGDSYHEIVQVAV